MVRNMIRRVIYKDAIIDIEEKPTPVFTGVKTYKATLLSGDWSNLYEELLVLADSNVIGHIDKLPDIKNFGGKITRFGKTAEITVYID